LSVHLNAAFDPFPNPFTGTGTGLVPDGLTDPPPAPGNALVVSIPVSGITEAISRVAVRMTVSHAWGGDLEAVLTSPDGTRSLVLFSRVGATTASSYGTGSDFNGTYIFTDSATGANLWSGAGDATLPPGSYRPTAAGGQGQTNPPPYTSLNATFGGMTPAQANGTWSLSFRDYCQADQATVSAAALSFSPIEGPSTENRLAGLSASSGSLSPGFSTATEAYAMTVPASTTSVTLTATPQDLGALIDVGLHGGELLPASAGAPSAPVSLSDGLNLVDVQVTAPSGALRTYRIAITRLGTSPTLTVPTRVAWDSGLNVPLRTDAWTMQFVYSEKLLRYLPPGSKIHGLAFRLYIGQATWPPTPRNWSDYSVQLSTATRPPGTLSPTFADNVGADAVTGRSGALSIPTEAYLGGGNPNAFGPALTFNAPYVYQGGDLLITLRHNGSGGGDTPLIETLPSQTGWFECLLGQGQSASAASFTSATPVIQLSFDLPSPEIALSGNAVAIASGDTTPSADDHTNFGSVRLDGGPFTRIFTLANTGEATLNLGGLQLTGHADFTLAEPLPATLAPGATTPFSLVFDPAVLGDRSAVVSIASDDADENPFTFTIQGRGIAPEITLSGNAVAIASGDTTPDVADHTDFGFVRLDGNPFSRTFTLANTGEATLLLTSQPVIEIVGEHAGDFHVLPPTESSLEPGAETLFTVRCQPRLPGLRQAELRIASDDPMTPSFRFAIQAFGQLPAPLPQTLTFSPPSVVYLSQSPLPLTAQASSGRPVLLELVSGPGLLNNGVLQLQAPGVVKVRATQPGGGNDAPASPVLRSITVKADPTQLTLLNLVQVYDGTPRAIETVGAGGLVTITYKVNGVERPEPPVSAGKYAVKAVAGTLSRTATLTILKAPLWVKPTDARRFAGQPNPTFAATYEGFAGGDDEAVLQPPVTLTTTARATSAGGFYPITSKGGGALNYELRHGSGTLVVESFGTAFEALLRQEGQPAGRLEITLNAANTSFSARLRTAMDRVPVTLAGALVLNAELEQTGATVANESGDLSFTLSLDGLMTAQARRNSLTLTATDGRRLRERSAARIPHAGAHTVLLEPALPSGAGVPAGAGWARASLAESGLLTLTGVLGDGAAFTAALPSDEGEDPGYRLFLQPYLPARTGAFLGGAFALVAHPSLANRRHVPEAGLLWAKTGDARDGSYPAGFSARSTVLLLDPWRKPARGETLPPLLGLADGQLGIEQDDTGSASNDQLPSRLLLSGTTLSVSDPAANSTRWKAALKIDSGLLTGSFELIDQGKKRIIPWTGLLRQPSLPNDLLIGGGQHVLPATAPGAGKTTGEIRFLVPEQ
jgi:hypothetical protein